MTARVGVARLDHLGDVVLSGPAIRAVATSGADVVALCGPRGSQVAELLPGVRAVVELEAPWISADPGAVDRAWLDDAVERLSDARLDQVVILTSFHQSALPLAMLLRLAGVSMIGGISEDYPGSLLDVRIAPPIGVHEVERALHVTAACGFHLPPDDDGRLALAVPHDAGASGSGAVVVHPGATAAARTWSADRFAGAVDALLASGTDVVVTGSWSEADLVRRVARGRAGTSIGGSLVELLDLLHRAPAVVVGNTGPAHLAAAVGTPVVSIFPPTVDPVAWRPWGVPHRLLGDLTIACAGCRARTCPILGHPCVSMVTAGDVVEAVGQLVAMRGRVWVDA